MPGGIRAEDMPGFRYPDLMRLREQHGTATGKETDSEIGIVDALRAEGIDPPIGGSVFDGPTTLNITTPIEGGAQ